MLKRTVLLSLIAAAGVVATVALFGVAPSSADKGGCPSAAAANGASHANVNSALGAEKQAARGCSDASPPPTPTPPPTNEADVAMYAVFVNSPATASVGVPFIVSASADLMNNGPANTLFMPTLPPDCSATFGAVTVEDSSAPMSTTVSISRSWTVTCGQAGDHMFRFDVSVAIDPAQALTDPNPANNSGMGSASTHTS